MRVAVNEQHNRLTQSDIDVALALWRTREAHLDETGWLAADDAKMQSDTATLPTSLDSASSAKLTALLGKEGVAVDSDSVEQRMKVSGIAAEKVRRVVHSSGLRPVLKAVELKLLSMKPTQDPTAALYMICC